MCSKLTVTSSIPIVLCTLPLVTNGFRYCFLTMNILWIWLRYHLTRACMCFKEAACNFISNYYSISYIAILRHFVSVLKPLKKIFIHHSETTTVELSMRNFIEVLPFKISSLRFLIFATNESSFLFKSFSMQKQRCIFRNNLIIPLSYDNFWIFFHLLVLTDVYWGSYGRIGFVPFKLSFLIQERRMFFVEVYLIWHIRDSFMLLTF